MIVVSDTTPLISLLKINRLDLLERLFGQVLIPQAVFNELTSDERFKNEADQIKGNCFISVKTVKNADAVDILKRATGLDKGESEAIVLTDELKADILLMDEAKGRAVSGQMGLKVMGTIGLLMAAYEEDVMNADEVRKCVDRLQQAGRHIGQRHYQMLLDRLKDQME
jgi:predicted nucleic acid-binding protein